MKKVLITLLLVMFTFPFIQKNVNNVSANSKDQEYVIKIKSEYDLNYSNVQFIVYEQHKDNNLMVESFNKYDNNPTIIDYFSNNGVYKFLGEKNEYLIQIDLTTLPAGYGVIYDYEYINSDIGYCEFIIEKISDIDFKCDNNLNYMVSFFSSEKNKLYSHYNISIDEYDNYFEASIDVNGEIFYKTDFKEDSSDVSNISSFNSNDLQANNTQNIYDNSCEYENFKVYYKSSDDEYENENIAAMAEYIAFYMFSAKNYFVSVLGFNNPNIIIENIDDITYNIVYLNIEPGSDSYNPFNGEVKYNENSQNECQIFITYKYIVNNFIRSSYMLQILESVCVHEYFHAIQASYGVNLSLSFIQESFSTFMEIYYISTKNYISSYYVKNLYEKRIWNSNFIYSSDPFGTYNSLYPYENNDGYGATLFNMFLYEKFDNVNFVKDFLEYYEQTKSNIYECYEYIALLNNTTFSLLLEEFGIFRINPYKYITNFDPYYFSNFKINDSLKYQIDSNIDNVTTNSYGINSPNEIKLNSWHLIMIEKKNLQNNQILKINLNFNAEINYEELNVYLVEDDESTNLKFSKIDLTSGNITLETDSALLSNNKLFIVIMNCTDASINNPYNISLDILNRNLSSSLSVNKNNIIDFNISHKSELHKIFVLENGYYKFELCLNQTDIDLLKKRSIEIYDSNFENICKLELVDSKIASSKEGEKTIVAYLNRTSDVYTGTENPYYIRLGFYNADIAGSVRITYLSDSESIINEEYFDNQKYIFQNQMQINNVSGDDFLLYNFSIDGELNIRFDAYNLLPNNNINIIIVAYNKENSSFYTISNNFLNIDNNSIDYQVNTKYYKFISILIFDCESNVDISAYIQLQCNNDFDILLDSSSDETLIGSEVRLNNGLPNQSDITLGFTRNVFLGSNSPSESRLDYIWTSSNENVATISAYGTILAIGYGKTIIQANYNGILKSVIMINVLPDLKTEVQNITITTDMRQDNSVGTYVSNNIGNAGENDIMVGYTRLMSLTLDAPSTIIQNYYWTSSDTNIATVSNYGTVKAISTGVVIITAHYKYNSRYSGSIILYIQ